MPELPRTELRSDRLHLRPWAPGDAAAVYDACQDPEIQRWLPLLPAPYTEADAREWVGHIAPEGWANGDSAGFGVFGFDGGLLGSVGVHRIDQRQGVAEVGYWTAAAARGRGVAAEAVRLTAPWAFAALGLGRLDLLHDVANAGSCRVAARAGFAAEAVLRSRLARRDGSRCDAELHMLLAPGLR